MPNVGTISGGMYLDPSGYITGLNQAAQSTKMFQVGVERVSFAGFHRGIFATTTLLYGLNRIMSSMSQGMEEYTNMLGRIGSVADMTAASVEALADSMKKLSVAQGVSRTDIMGGMYTAAQSGFSSPKEMREMAMSGALLSRASGKEIDVRKSVDLLAGLRQGLGIKAGAISSNRTTDLLLKSRDIGRWELSEMAEAIGKVATVYGNQFKDTLGGEEVLRQISAIMSVANLTGLPQNMVSTGTRRLAERTFQLAGSKRGEALAAAFRGRGYTSGNPILSAYRKGPLSYLMELTDLTGGDAEELYRYGYQARELATLTSALRGRGSQLMDAYGNLDYRSISGTTQKYNQTMLQTYDAKRDQLRSQWQITSQEFMQASIPLIGSLVSVLTGLNEVAQSLPSSVKSFMMLVSSLAAMRLALNFAGFRSQHVGLGAAMGKGGVSGAGGSVLTKALGTGASATAYARPENAVALRQSRRASVAASRGATPTFGSASNLWVPNAGMPWGTSFAPFRPMAWNEIPQLDRTPGGGFGPTWYNDPRGDPMNYYQYQNMLATGKKYDLLREANNRKFWAPNGNMWVRPSGGQSTLTPDRQARLSQMGAFAQRYGVMNPALGTPLSGANLSPGSRTTQWGPTAEARIHWAAYKQGQSVDFDKGTYSTMSPGAAAYAQRSQSQGSMSVREYRAALASLGSGQIGMTSPFVSNLGRTMVDGDYGQIGMSQQVGRYVGASGVFSENGIRPKAAMYASMGVGGISQVVGQAVSGISKFGSAIWSVVGPMAQFGAIFTTLLKILEGWSYTGNQGGMVGGKPKLESGGNGFALLSSIGHGYRMMGSFLHNGTDYLGDMTEDYAREQGYVPGIDKNTPMQLLGSVLPAVGIFNALRGRPMGLQGWRKGKLGDAVKDSSREVLSPYDVRQLSKPGGVNFDDFKTVKPYLNRYISEQLDHTPPDDWDAWMDQTKGGYGKVMKWSADALRFYKSEIAGNIQRAYDKKNGIWRAGAPDDIREGLVEARALRDKQWDVYKSADYSTPNGNGSLNWGAGGRDYRKLYDEELARMDRSYGNFVSPSPYDAAQGRIENLNTMWKRRAAANGMKFDSLSIDENLQFALKDAKGESERQKNLRGFLRVMPDIGTMDVDTAKGWFTKMTGRDADSGAAFDSANFDNFRHMDLRNFITPESIGHEVKYAGATQFGTAEAYNQLLPKQDFAEKLNVAADKLTEYFATMTADRGEKDTALDGIMKQAALFLKEAENTKFFTNIAEIADNTGDL